MSFVCVSLKKPHWLYGLIAFSLLLGVQALAQSSRFSQDQYGLLPAEPESPYINIDQDGLDPGFCAQWNPEYAYRGYQCCPTHPVKAVSKRRSGRRSSRIKFCASQRIKFNYCDEMTDEQKFYLEMVKAGATDNLLDFLQQELRIRRTQSYCTVNNGFLAWGRPIVGTVANRLVVKSEARCENFGTDPMAAMMEWLGYQVAIQYSSHEYKGVRLLVGGISAPRGGCVTGYSGRRGHASHTSGRDVDFGFLSVRAGYPSPPNFSRDFDPKVNWWLLKQLFNNPFACVKVVFLDKRHIRKLAKAALGDPEWAMLRSHIRHIKGHRDHYHVRIGDGPGKPGCFMRPELDPDLNDESEESEFDWEAPTPLQIVDADVDQKQRAPAYSE